LSSLTVHAYAKINLHLHIIGREKNGFHLLNSWVAFTNISDELYLKKSAQFEFNVLESKIKMDCLSSDNLVARAGQLFCSYLQVPTRFQISLLKNIPSAAGLGGGSADAAATLLGLNKLLGLPATEEDLYAMACQLGSDIISCLKNTSTIMDGTGQILSPAPLFPMLHGILINPNTPCPTPQVYGRYASSDIVFSEPIIFPKEFKTPETIYDFLNNYTHNDLTEAAIQLNPDIGDVIKALKNQKNCQLARMSGSGATCFGLFDNQEKMIESYDILKVKYPNWWIKKIKINEKKD